MAELEIAFEIAPEDFYAGQRVHDLVALLRRTEMASVASLRVRVEYILSCISVFRGDFESDLKLRHATEQCARWVREQSLLQHFVLE